MSKHVPLLFIFTDPPTTEIYTLSLHDALPISDDRRPAALEVRRRAHSPPRGARRVRFPERHLAAHGSRQDRKSTRLNSSHPSSSYAVFCLKKKKTAYPASVRSVVGFCPRAPRT